MNKAKAFSWWLVLVLAGGCANGKLTEQIPTLQPVQEAGLTKAGEWDIQSGVLVNVIPPLASMADLAQAKDGMGISTAIAPGVAMQDLEAEAEFSFDTHGVAGLCFRMRQDDKGVVTAMYSVAVFNQGVHLWRFYGGNWSRLNSYFMEIAPDEPHRLHVKLRGDRIAVSLDDTRVMDALDTALIISGSVGVRATEGHCRFMSLRVKSLD